MTARNAHAAEKLGLWLGVLGVAIFALTLPMTRMAVGTPQAPQLAGVFVGMGRAVLAALLLRAWIARTFLPGRRRGIAASTATSSNSTARLSACDAVATEFQIAGSGAFRDARKLPFRYAT